MFSTKYTQESLFLKKEDILALATDEEIFRFYLGDFELRKMFNSPLRKDPVPSFNIYCNSSGELQYKDFGGTMGSFVDLVMNLYNLTYKEALHRIYKDLNLSQRKENKLTRQSIVVRKDTVIKVKTKKFSESEIEYWKAYGITLPMLVKYNVYSAEEVWLNGKLFFKSIPTNPIFVYYFPKTGKVKIYRPLDTSKKKWLTNCSLEDIQGLDQLEDSNCLIITKSLKDVMVFNLLGFSAIAPHGEGMHIPATIVADLKTRFKKMITVYDNDEPGVNASIRLNATLGNDYWNIPSSYSEKDISDFIKAYGTEKTEELLSSLITKCCI